MAVRIIQTPLPPTLRGASHVGISSRRRWAGPAHQGEKGRSGGGSGWRHLGPVNHSGTGEVTLAGEIEVLEQGESGLLGMAFHPDFTNRPHLYVAPSSRDGGGVRNRLIRV